MEPLSAILGTFDVTSTAGDTAVVSTQENHVANEGHSDEVDAQDAAAPTDDVVVSTQDVLDANEVDVPEDEALREEDEPSFEAEADTAHSAGTKVGGRFSSVGACLVKVVTLSRDCSSKYITPFFMFQSLGGVDRELMC